MDTICKLIVEFGCIKRIISLFVDKIKILFCVVIMNFKKYVSAI